MKNSIEIFNELKQISPLLAGMEKTNVFSVPDNYFGLIESSVITKLNLIRKISSLRDKPTLSAPEGYFNTLSENILDYIKNSSLSSSEELRSISPLLYAIRNEEVFTTPPGYFDELPQEVVLKVKPQDAMIIRMRRRSSIWQYSRAAVMTGIIALSALMVYNNQSPYVSTESGQYSSEQQINEGISKLSNDEIIKYLEVNTTGDETISNNVDEKQLPDQKDLLNNESNGDSEANPAESSP